MPSCQHWFRVGLSTALIFLSSSGAHAAQAPTITAAYSNSPGMATIAYQHPGNDAVRQFRLQQGDETVLLSAHLSDTFTVLGLQPSTTYQFRVCAAYDDDQHCSEAVSLTTMATQAARPPQVAPEVRYVRSTANNVTIGWGNVGDYKKLLVRVEDIHGNSDQRDLAPAAFAEYTFQGMRPGARYKLMIKGCGDPNYQSCGPWSAGHWVNTSGASRCIPGYVWREAYPGDVVCVTPEVRDQAADDNAAAASRIAACRQGYVFRDAVRGDRVCVTASAKALAASENELNIERSTFRECAVLSPDPSQCPKPAPCKSGFVHRNATSHDSVCVPPEARIRVAQENGQHAQNSGGNRCISGYVWRVAAPDDLVCVTPEVRKQVASDNAAAGQRVVQ